MREMLVLGIICQYPRLGPAPLSSAALKKLPEAIVAIVRVRNILVFMKIAVQVEPDDKDRCSVLASRAFEV